MPVRIKDKKLFQTYMNASSTEKSSVPGSNRTRGKSFGCLLYFLVFFCIWLAIAWGLWHIAKDHPSLQHEKSGASLFFEIIPGSDERTSVDDNMDDRGRAKQEDPADANK